MKHERCEPTALGEMKENHMRFSPGANVHIHVRGGACVCVRMRVGVREVTTLLAGG